MKNRIYHLKTTLNTLYKLKYPNEGDTRNYVDLDETERDLLVELIVVELNKLDPG